MSAQMIFSRRNHQRTRLVLSASVAFLLSAGGIGGAETIVEHIEEPGLLGPTGIEQTDAEATGAVKPAHRPLDTGTEIERFCSNIADAARDRRYMLQTAGASGPPGRRSTSASGFWRRSAPSTRPG
jgi:flagellar motility protein MotE (MotC chaperone)